MLCVHVSSSMTQNMHTRDSCSSDVAIAMFSGPAQLSIAYSTVLQAMESWAGPENMANVAMYWYSRGEGRRD